MTTTPNEFRETTWWILDDMIEELTSRRVDSWHGSMNVIHSKRKELVEYLEASKELIGELTGVKRNV